MSKLRKLVWVDCEMTGLNTLSDVIIEVCCIVTDEKLQPLAPQPYHSYIHQSKSVMDGMNAWCVQHHGESGLTEAVLASKKKRQQVELELLAYVKEYCGQGEGLLAGNSVHMDRVFMAKDLPSVVDWLHYRIVDVSSIYELVQMWNPKAAKGRPTKLKLHTAESDIMESIAELAYYKDKIFHN
ncbi:Rex2 protein [Martiniozyma asiatica (nom. inval.)]|nr:Rex2 protein [Martiniozyma asiatica]